jgi:predicted transglutaminase-like cysteine proteinase
VSAKPINNPNAGRWNVLNKAIIRALALAAFCSSSALVTAHQNPFVVRTPTNDGERFELWQTANLVQDEPAGKYREFTGLPGNMVSGAVAQSSGDPPETLSLSEFGSTIQDMLNGAGTPPKDSDAFDQQTFGSQKGEVQARWTELWSRVLADANSISICRVRNDLCSRAEHRFLSILDAGRKVEGRAQLGWINRAVNLAIRPMSDWAQYGYAQYWASPLQTLTSEAGDCKDYAIVKFAILRQLGIAQEDLRLVIVYDNQRETEHEVVAVRQDQQWLILDNLTMAILDARQIRRYSPMFVMDYRGAREFAATVARR